MKPGFKMKKAGCLTRPKFQISSIMVRYSNINDLWDLIFPFKSYEFTSGKTKLEVNKKAKKEGKIPMWSNKILKESKIF